MVLAEIGATRMTIPKSPQALGALLLASFIVAPWGLDLDQGGTEKARYEDFIAINGEALSREFPVAALSSLKLRAVIRRSI